MQADQLSTQRLQSVFETRTFLLRGDGANRCISTTAPPTVFATVAFTSRIYKATLESIL